MTNGGGPLPHDDPELERQRERTDEAKERERTRSNEHRESRRELNDLKRSHARGTRQDREGLERERRQNDDDLARERELADASGSAERAAADELIGRQAKALVHAGDSLRQVEVEGLTRDLERRDLIERALAEVGRIGEAAASLLVQEANGPGGVLTERVETVRGAVERAQEALRRALTLK